MDRSWAGVAAGLLVILAACAAEAPGETPFLVISGPAEFAGLELRGHGDEVLWRLSADPPVPLAELHYGRVPAGFRQELPSAGEPPRPFEPGEPLELVSTTPERVFRHTGYAAGEGRFTIEGWQMQLRQPRAAAAVDGSPDSP